MRQMASLCRRASSILLVAAFYRLDCILFKPSKGFACLRLIQCLYWRSSYHRIKKKALTQGQALCLSLEALGPLFIKLGQMLSARQDILPLDLTQALAQLQDRVPPFPGEEAKRSLEHLYQRPIHDVFAYFEQEAVASASIAQVHRAVLYTGETVAVKILRPGIQAMIQHDLKLLTVLVKTICFFSKEARRLGLPAVVQQFKKILLSELDLCREAANAGQFKRYFQASSLMSTPKIHWQYTRASVLVQEYIEAAPFKVWIQEGHTQIDRRQIAKQLLEVFFTQVFRDRFFHADIHPGNLFIKRDVDTKRLPVWRCVYVDFGIVGSFTDDDCDYLIQNMKALYRRDYRGIAKLHLQSGWLPPGTQEDEFESAVRTFCEPLFERGLSQLSCSDLLLALFQIGHEFKMSILPQFILLHKTLFTLEGLVRQLDPDLDLLKTIQPFIEPWGRQSNGLSACIRLYVESLLRFLLGQRLL